MILVVHDSNGDKINMQRLKPGTNVVGARRVTIQKAIDSLPCVDDPQNVSDILYNVSLNDSRNGLSPEKVREALFEMIKNYHNKFKNARHHLTGLLPLSDRQIETSDQIRVLANNAGCQFVSTKAFRDHNMGELRGNLINVSFCRRSLLHSSKCMPSLKRHFPFSVWMNMIT